MRICNYVFRPEEKRGKGGKKGRPFSPPRGAFFLPSAPYFEKGKKKDGLACVKAIMQAVYHLFRVEGGRKKEEEEGTKLLAENAKKGPSPLSLFFLPLFSLKVERGPFPFSLFRDR